MAYYSSSSYYHDENFGEYYQTPNYDHDGSHDFFPSQASLAADSSYAYNDYNYNYNYNYDYDDDYDYDYDYDYNAFEYDPAPCYGAYDPDIGQPVVSYSSYTCSEPKYVEYGLDPYGGDYTTVKTRFIISYSVSNQFNETEFDEYDPTPYGGGYDPDATYGKPLSPSEAICYPPSSSSAGPDDVSLANFSFASIESPYGKQGGVDEPVTKPSNGSKPATISKDQEKQSQENINNTSADGNADSSNEKPADNSYQGEESKEDCGEYEKRVTQIPPGYGLEAMDLCESLFGYWPCLARAKRENNDYRHCQGVCINGSNDNCQWEGTADYLFGNCYPYGERWSIGGRYENPLFNYQRHYQEQSLSMQVEYHEDYSWLN